MPLPSNTLIDALEFLLPGFLAAAIFSSLSINVKVGGLVLIVYAFILTTVVHFIYRVCVELLPANSWSAAWNEIVLVAIAIFVGIVISICWNRDFPHRVFRILRITRQSTHQSTIYSAFTKRSCYIVLHMGERRLYGWPLQWPSTQEEEYVLLEEPLWLDRDLGNDSEEHGTTSHMLVSLSQVDFVEFVEGRER